MNNLFVPKLQPLEKTLCDKKSARVSSNEFRRKIGTIKFMSQKVKMSHHQIISMDFHFRQKNNFFFVHFFCIKKILWRQRLVFYALISKGLQFSQNCRKYAINLWSRVFPDLNVDLNNSVYFTFKNFVCLAKRNVSILWDFIFSIFFEKMSLW